MSNALGFFPLRSRLRVAPLMVAAAMTLLFTAPASALNWGVYQCHLGGLECPQIGTPTAPCDCGLYKDSPGVATASRKDTAFVFVSSNVVAGDETAEWRATLAAPINNLATVEVRAAVNDTSDLTVVLYDSTGGGYVDCSTDDGNVVAVLDWAENEADSRFSVKTGAIGGSHTVAAICLIVSDSPDTTMPVSRRSSAIVDYIAVLTAGGAKTFVEDFGLNQ